MSTAFATPVTGDMSRERFRSEHKVRLVRPDEDGFSLFKLPPGVYGFTYAPTTETPVFERQSFHSFEVHRLPDSSGRLLVYVSAEDLAQLNGREKLFSVTGYPDPWESATHLVAIPFDWILNSLHKPVRQDGNGIPLRLSPDR